MQIKDTTFFKYPITGDYVLQNWVIKCIDENYNGKKQKFVKSTKSNSPASYSGATSLPAIGNSFLYIEIPSKNLGNIVFVSFERTGTIQISNSTSIIFNFN